MNAHIHFSAIVKTYDVKRAGETLATYIASDADLALQFYSELVGITVTHLILMGVDAYERKSTHGKSSKELN